MLSVWSQRKSAVAEERETQFGVASDPYQAVVGLHGGGVDGVGTQVGQLGVLEVAPHLLDGVEVVGVAGEPPDTKPAALGGQPRCHGAAAMGGQPVPDQRGPAAV